MRVRSMSVMICCVLLFCSNPASGQAGAQVSWQPAIAGVLLPFRISVGTNGLTISYHSPGLETPIGTFTLVGAATYNPNGRSQPTGPIAGSTARVSMYLDGKLIQTQTVQRVGGYAITIDKGLRVVSFQLDGDLLCINLTRDLAQQQLKQAKTIIADQNARIGQLAAKVKLLRSQRDEAYLAVQDMTHQAKERGERARTAQQSLQQGQSQNAELQARIVALTDEVKRKDEELATLQRQLDGLFLPTGRTQDRGQGAGGGFHVGEPDGSGSSAGSNSASRTVRTVRTVGGTVRQAREAINQQDRAAGRPITFPHP